MHTNITVYSIHMYVKVVQLIHATSEYRDIGQQDHALLHCQAQPVQRGMHTSISIRRNDNKYIGATTLFRALLLFNWIQVSRGGDP